VEFFGNQLSNLNLKKILILCKSSCTIDEVLRGDKTHEKVKNVNFLSKSWCWKGSYFLWRRKLVYGSPVKFSKSFLSGSNPDIIIFLWKSFFIQTGKQNFKIHLKTSFVIWTLRAIIVIFCTFELFSWKWIEINFDLKSESKISEGWYIS
jgi:hypothetical protein